MFPKLIPKLTLMKSFLCMRRDVSIKKGSYCQLLPFSLHAQRCFYKKPRRPHRGRVFSACAEMFLSVVASMIGVSGFLCMRRDVSVAIGAVGAVALFSLHAQRCF